MFDYIKHCKPFLKDESWRKMDATCLFNWFVVADSAKVFQIIPSHHTVYSELVLRMLLSWIQ